MRRRRVLALGALALCLWCAPLLALQLWLAIEAPALGLEATARGLRPAWPLGIRVRKLFLSHGPARLPLRDLRLLWGPGGWHGEARLQAGSVRLYARPLGDAAVVYVRELPLERLELIEPELRLSGVATGVVRVRDEGVEMSGRAHAGTLAAGTQSAIGIPFDVIDALAAVDPAGRIQLRRVLFSGATLVMDASGFVDPAGPVDLQLHIVQLAEPLRTALEGLGVQVRRLPTRVSITGTLQSPLILALDAR